MAETHTICVLCRKSKTPMRINATDFNSELHEKITESELRELTKPVKTKVVAVDDEGDELPPPKRETKTDADEDAEDEGAESKPKKGKGK